MKVYKLWITQNHLKSLAITRITLKIAFPWNYFGECNNVFLNKFGTLHRGIKAIKPCTKTLHQTGVLQMFLF